jgi:hypothetical protein
MSTPITWLAIIRDLVMVKSLFNLGTVRNVKIGHYWFVTHSPIFPKTELQVGNASSTLLRTWVNDP